MATALTRLVLAQRLGLWGGTKDGDVDITSTTTPDDGHVEDLVAFVDQSWIDIQISQAPGRWLWMRERLVDTVSLSASTRTLAMSAIDSTCDRVIPFIAHDVYPQRYILLTHPTSGQVGKCVYVPYEVFRGYLDRGTRSEARPAKFTVRPDGTLEFDPTPDVAYTVNCDWVHVPTELTADASTPDMPAQFHMLIVWWAIIHLMGYDENGRRYQTAARQFDRMHNRLLIDQLVEDTSNEFLSTMDVY